MQNNRMWSVNIWLHLILTSQCISLLPLHKSQKIPHHLFDKTPCPPENAFELLLSLVPNEQQMCATFLLQYCKPTEIITISLTCQMQTCHCKKRKRIYCTSTCSSTLLLTEMAIFVDSTTNMYFLLGNNFENA